MILEINTEHTDFKKDILPFIRKGILIDTSVMKIFIDGFINLRFSKKLDEDYNDLISLFEYLNISNKWNKFWITPHLFTEICKHFCEDNKRNKWSNFKEIVKEIIPVLRELNEKKDISKNQILDLINMDKPVIESGDLSIFVAVDNFLNTSDEKTAIMVKDDDIRRRYENYPNVMIIDYKKTILDLKQRR